MLESFELEKIFEVLHRYFPVSSEAEITLEANPDDLTKEKILQLKSSPVNRLSIGVQSFLEKDLRWMNRSHNAQQAVESINHAQNSGFENISLDLIYGLPDSLNTEWEENIGRALEIGVQHLSCYCLTVEPKTALAHFISLGKSRPVNEEQAAQQFEILMKKMKEHQWLHYEISNFSFSERFISKHNSSYWRRKKYLGLGPSAHSFDGTSRQWNVAGIHQYIESISKDKVPFEKEILDEGQVVNEKIMTELRTMWGLSISDFGLGISDLLKGKSKPFVEDGFVELNSDSLILTDEGKLIADKIILELMIEEFEVSRA